MATYVLKFRLSQAPVARLDGSGMVEHAMQIIYQVDGVGNWLDVSGLGKTIMVPTARLKTVNDMPHSTALQKTSKNAAYKTLLSDCLEGAAVPMPLRWSAGAIIAFLEANAAAAAEAVRANAYIVTTLALAYPVDFGM
jgi:hypothetical protein